MTATGKLGYFPGAKGGKRPGFWDGSVWRDFGGSRQPIETEGDGIWIVGLGTSTGPTTEVAGFYYYSLDGFNWDLSDGEIMTNIIGSAYANGMWVVSGQSGSSGIAGSSTDPSAFATWRGSPPFGFTGGTAAGPATEYDNGTGEFTVPFVGAGSQTILNDTGAADPTDPSWPHQGVENNLGVGFSSDPMPGVATGGIPVEVRITTKEIIIDSNSIFGALQNRPGVPPDLAGGDQPFPSHYWGTHATDFLEVRRMGAPFWTVPAGGNNLFLSGNRVEAAGLSLKGLVWGVPKKAVEFAAGSD